MMLTFLRRIGMPLMAMSLLISLSACVVYPIGGGGYYGRPHGYYYGGGGYYGHGGNGPGYYHH